MNTSLTTYEKQLVSDRQALIIKNIIIQKVIYLFGILAEAYKKELNYKIPNWENVINPKISRGENYLGLPYVILDFPRQFGKADVFAIRSFFWWGNFFSITLHLSGLYQQQYASALQNAIDKNFLSDWYIGNGENQWDHHFEKSNYLTLAGMQINIEDLHFLKLAKKIPLSEWDKTSSFFIENFRLLINTLVTQAPIL